MATQPPNHQATVVRTTGLWHEVRMEDGEVVSARVPGRFRLREEMVTNPVAVGDQVMVAMQADETGVIEEILPRRNKLSRKAAGRKAGMEHVIVANVDFAWCVQSVKLPRFNIGFIDRFFVVAEAYGIPAGLVVNKLDLLADKKRERLGEAVGVYEDLGYPVLLVSAETGEGLDDFRAALDGQLSAIAGPSGVGKSTLLNAIEPGLDLRTGTVSKKTQKGRHTTTFAELHRVGDAGYVIDTPGIREFGIWDMEPPELAGYFIEMLPYLDDCRFPNCTHDHEPDCAVQNAVDLDEIDVVRYDSYLSILHSLREDNTRRR